MLRRAALQKCVDEVEEKLAETEAELLKTKRATKLAEARLNDSKLEVLVHCVEFDIGPGAQAAAARGAAS